MVLKISINKSLVEFQKSRFWFLSISHHEAEPVLHVLNLKSRLSILLKCVPIKNQCTSCSMCFAQGASLVLSAIHSKIPNINFFFGR